jgi:hypothetical protein
MAVIAPKAMRGPGLVGVTRPATNAQPNTQYQFVALMDAADIADPTLVLTGLKLLLDARVVWQGDWQCGTSVDKHTGAFLPPHFEYACPEAPPANYRVEVTLPRAVNIGLDVSLA